MTANDDLDDVRAAMNSDLEAFGRLTNRYSHALTAFAYSRCGNIVDAQDVVQDTLIKAFKSLNSLKQPERFLSWLFQIARNECQQLYRFENKQRKLAEDITSSYANGSAAYNDSQPEQSLHEEETAQLLKAAVMRLPEPLQEIIVLRYFSGLCRSEIVSLLEITPDAYDKRHQRALAQIKSELSQPSDAH